MLSHTHTRPEPIGMSATVGFWDGHHRVEIELLVDDGTASVVVRLFEMGNGIYRPVEHDSTLALGRSESLLIFPDATHHWLAGRVANGLRGEVWEYLVAACKKAHTIYVRSCSHKMNRLDPIAPTLPGT